MSKVGLMFGNKDKNIRKTDINTHKILYVCYI
jgi:hypothetical protein